MQKTLKLVDNRNVEIRAQEHSKFHTLSSSEIIVRSVKFWPNYSKLNHARFLGTWCSNISCSSSLAYASVQIYYGKGKKAVHRNVQCLTLKSSSKRSITVWVIMNRFFYHKLTLILSQHKRYSIKLLGPIILLLLLHTEYLLAPYLLL